MGKGGKKNKKKQEDEPPSVEGLSLGEASTSGAPPAEPVPEKPKETTPAPAKPDDDDEGGLGLGGPRKKNKKKKATPSAAAAPAPAPSPAVPSPAVPGPGSHGPLGPSPAYGHGPHGPGAPMPGGHRAGPLGPGPTYGPPPGSGAPPPWSGPGAASATSPMTSYGPPGVAQSPSAPDVGGASWSRRSQDIRVSSAYGQESREPPKGAPPGFTPTGYPGPQSPQSPMQPPTQYSGAGRGRGPPPQAQPKTRVIDSTPSEQTRQSGGPLCRFKIPKKIEGRSVPASATRVYTNYLQMSFKDFNIHRYDLSFKPEIKKLIPKAYDQARKKHFPKSLIAFDQMKNCYTLKALPGVPETDRFSTEVEVTDNNGRAVKFEVSFKFTGIVALNRIRQYMSTGGTSLNPPSEAIQCIDVILRQGALESYVKAGRQFFKRPANPIDLSGGLEMWTGLFQSAIFTSKAFINIDVAHKGFPKYQPLITTLVKDFQLDPSSPLDQQNRRSLETFQQFLKGLRVIASIGGDTTNAGQKREFLCNGTVRPANVETFDFADATTGRKERLTVADFFNRKKGIRLRYPNLNCVWVGPRDKSIYYPMELLHVGFGQALNRQLNENQLRTMVMKAATPPDVRKRKIEEIIKDMNYSNNQYFKEFGLDISNQFYEVEARVLQPPQLDVGSGRPVIPKRGEWRQQGLLKAEPLQSWGIIAVDINPNSCDFQNIIGMIMSTARRMGMNANEPVVRRTDVNMRSLEMSLDEAAKKRVRLVFVIVGTRSRDLYHKVKQIAERKIGILTQCIKENTASRRINDQTIQNILLKVNSKLMGINQAIPERSLPRCLQGGGVMVVGADVTHPSPDQSSIPSIAAVTASIDPKCYIYNIELSIQTPKKEMIVQFEDMMVNHLKVYQERLRCLPKKIFVFRDGVSEGQFAEVMNSELQAVHQAYHRMTGRPEKPEVLFLLVQKRHHTRLFPKNNPNYNVEPGTVVDKDIVHASELDFYLVSHQAIKGTARPTRYHAVCNDGEIKHDEVEQLTFYLCHLFSRCTRSVSYPTPTYYAHLACLRARSLTHGETFDNDELERRPRRLQVLENIYRVSPMFFV